jgi:RHS repeat-associated protein
LLLSGGLTATREERITEPLSRLRSARISARITSGNTYVYDAWNRLVTVKNNGSTVAAYGYDGLSRRITETHGSTTTGLYLSAAGQVLEERVGGVVQARNVWSPVYVNALVLRDQSSQDNGVLDQRLYVQQDANWNVTSLVDTSGNVVERYDYDLFGLQTVLNPGFSVRGTSAYAVPYGFQGMRTDLLMGVQFADNRVYSPMLMRWLQTDPIGLKAGNNDYEFVSNEPTDAVDPIGDLAERGRKQLQVYINPFPWTEGIGFNAVAGSIGKQLQRILVPVYQIIDPFFYSTAGIPRTTPIGVIGTRTRIVLPVYEEGEHRRINNGILLASYPEVIATSVPKIPCATLGKPMPLPTPPPRRLPQEIIDELVKPLPLQPTGSIPIGMGLPITYQNPLFPGAFPALTPKPGRLEGMILGPPKTTGMGLSVYRTNPQGVIGTFSDYTIWIYYKSNWTGPVPWDPALYPQYPHRPHSQR